MEEIEKIENFLKNIKDEVYLKDGETFHPEKYHISLGIKKGFLDPVPYMEYDPEKKKVLGVHKRLKPTLIGFMRYTNNLHLIPSIQENL